MAPGIPGFAKEVVWTVDWHGDIGTCSSCWRNFYSRMAFLRQPTLWDGVFLTRHHLSRWKLVLMLTILNLLGAFFRSIVQVRYNISPTRIGSFIPSGGRATSDGISRNFSSIDAVFRWWGSARCTIWTNWTRIYEACWWPLQTTSCIANIYEACWWPLQTTSCIANIYEACWWPLQTTSCIANWQFEYIQCL